MSQTRPLNIRFAILDALILGMAIALGVWISAADPKNVEAALGLGNTQILFEAEQEMMRRYEEQGEDKPRAGSLHERLSLWQRNVLRVGSQFLPFLTVGGVIAIFRHREARRRRALRSVGILTMAVAGSFLAVSLVSEFMLRRFAIFETGYRHNAFSTLWHSLGIEMGLALSALWAVLALGGRWRSSGGWADRMGCMLGVAWVSYALLGRVLSYLFMP